MDVSRILAEYLIPGFIFNSTIIVFVDAMIGFVSNGKLHLNLSSFQGQSWMGSILLLLFISISYFIGFLISATMLKFSEEKRKKSASEVEGLTDLFSNHKDRLIAMKFTDKEKLDLEEDWNRLYLKLLTSVMILCSAS